MPDLICYCFRVDKPAIVAAIEAGCLTVDALSARLRVSTGCGGCRPDLEDMLRFYRSDSPVSAPARTTPQNYPKKTV
jgi:NAD(P)H-nitrite reductase large subunit